MTLALSCGLLTLPRQKLHTEHSKGGISVYVS